MRGAVGIVDGAVVRVRCVGLARSCGRSKDMDCLSGVASEERTALFIVGGGIREKAWFV